MKRTVNMGNEEPSQKSFPKPSEGEHLFQVVDVFDSTNAPGKMVLDDNTVSVKLEVAIGDEIGRTMLHRLNLDPFWKGFFATRLFLKAIGEPYKGDGIEIDTDRWIGRQLFAVVVHNGDYVNISEYNFEKCESLDQVSTTPQSPADIEWSE